MSSGVSFLEGSHGFFEETLAAVVALAQNRSQPSEVCDGCGRVWTGVDGCGRVLRVGASRWRIEGGGRLTL